jgi:hypothetical protein
MGIVFVPIVRGGGWFGGCAGGPLGLGLLGFGLGAEVTPPGGGDSGSEGGGS